MKWVIVKDTKVKTATVYANAPQNFVQDSEYGKACSTIYDSYEEALKATVIAERYNPVPFIPCPCDPTLSHDTGLKEYVCLL